MHSENETTNGGQTMTISSAEFSAMLREAAVKLASGEQPEMFMSDDQLDNILNETDRHKINASYIRTVINRVPEVKAIGRAKVTRSDGVDRPVGFIVEINHEPKRKVYTDEDIPAIEQKARSKFAQRLLGFMPNVMHMEGDKRDGAIEGIALYQDMIRKLAGE